MLSFLPNLQISFHPWINSNEAKGLAEAAVAAAVV
jgi:hypothetical protein